MSDQERYCKHCKRKIIVTAGHRPREYCNDVCRQAAHRERVEAARLEEERAAQLVQIQQERARLLKQYGNLLPETLDFLQSLQSATLVGKIVKAIRAEQDLARKSQLQERNALIEDLLLTGEQLGYQRLVNDDFELDPGVERWLAFVESASLEELYQARDVVRIKILATDGRKRLAQLVPQT